MGFFLFFWRPILYLFILLYCVVTAVNELEVVDGTHGVTFLSPCDLFSDAKRLRGLNL